MFLHISNPYYRTHRTQLARVKCIAEHGANLTDSEKTGLSHEAQAECEQHRSDKQKCTVPALWMSLHEYLCTFLRLLRQPRRTAECLQYDTEFSISLLQMQIRRPPEHRICPLWTPHYSFRNLFRNYSQRRLLEQHAVIKINRSLIKACMNFIFWPSGKSVFFTAPESWGSRPHRQRYWHFLKPSTNFLYLKIDYSLSGNWIPQYMEIFFI